MVGSWWGLFPFLLLRNDIVWDLLKEEEKTIVLANNARHNVVRETYANPELYLGGKSFDSPRDEPLGIVEEELIKFLEQKKPASVLEIGPGSGYLTKRIVDSSLDNYIAVDINEAFLDFLRPRLEEIKANRPGFKYSLIAGDINQLNLEERVDAVILLSAVHHIPDRFALFQKLKSYLTDNGSIFMGEPAHYFPRIAHLARKIFTGYRNPVYWSDQKNFGTHHFCTFEEFDRIAKTIGGLKINRVRYFRVTFPIPLRKGLGRLLLFLGKRPQPDGTYESLHPHSWLRFFADRQVVRMDVSR
jgi:SAM-dependent methyltransferase